MIAAWMVYLLAITALLAVAAHAAEKVMRLRRRAGRGVWVAALLLTSLAPMLTRSAMRATRSHIDNVLLRPGSATRLHSLPAGPTNTIERALIPPFVNVPSHSSLLALDHPLLYLWIGGSLALCAFLFLSNLRLSIWSKGWETRVIDEVPVLVSENVGPAAIGPIFPRIVVPRWVLDLPVEQRLLLLTHETQHIRSRDPLLLNAAWLAIILTPWNPVAWYALGRLRLAIELDCDRQVLLLRPDAYTYGSLLLDVNARTFATGASIAALSGPARHLRKRLLLMHQSSDRFRRAHTIAGVAIASAAVALACQVPKPVATETRDTQRSRFITHSELPKLQNTLGWNTVPDSEIRRAVAVRYPGALTGHMGPHPYIWILTDRQGRILRSATGRDGLSRWSYKYLRDSMPSFLTVMTPAERATAKVNGLEYLDAAAMRRKFPGNKGVVNSAEPLSIYTTRLQGTDVDVAWLRLAQ
ncbi:MAG: M56 family metallopeptidase [Gemmatimonadaceae bacterium]